MFKRWFSSPGEGLGRPAKSGNTRRNRLQARPTLEVLEDRYVLSTLAVGSLLDDNSAGTLRSAVAAAAAGDTITFDPSLNGQAITLSEGEIVITKSLTIQGPGATQLAIDGNNASRLFDIEGDGSLRVVISGLTLTGGNGTSAPSTASLPPGATTAAGGGAVYNANDNLTLAGVVLTGNTSDNGPGGAVLNQAGTLTLANSVLQGNTTGDAGGAIFNGSGPLTVGSSTIRGNTATTDGGGIASDTGAVTLQNDNITGNTAGGKGGGFNANSPGGQVLLETSTFSGNTAHDDGGGLAVGTTGTDGLSLQGVTLTGNRTSAGHGGGIAVGGGAGPVVLFATSVLGNTAATEGGGGIFLNGPAAGTTIQDSTIAGNHAGDGTGGNGGGLLLNDATGPVTIQNATISGNLATNGGGGIFDAHTAGSFRIVSSTIASNSAGTNGGGLRIEPAGNLTQLESTILASNAAGSSGADVSNAGILVAAVNNLVENGFTGIAPTAVSGNIVGQDPKLGGLRNNGGPTLTQALGTGSPAIDAGSNPAGDSTDQRGSGFSRTVGTRTDIGAFEADTLAPTATLDSANDVSDDTAPDHQDITVTFSDDRGIRFSSLADSTLQVSGPNGFIGQAAFLSANASTDTPTIMVTYRLTAPTGTWNAGDNGTYTVEVKDGQVLDIDGNAVPAGKLGSFDVNVTAPSPTPPPPPPAPPPPPTSAPANIFAVGADAGGAPVVRVFDATTRAVKAELVPYGPTFTGGVRVAVGDVNGDRIEDIITAPGPGGPPDIKVFDGRTFAQIYSFWAYDPSFTGGVYVASGDVNGDGLADIVTGPDAGGFPNVKAFSGRDLAQICSFMAYGDDFLGGVRVGTGDFNGDGRADIITGAGPGAGPHVKVFCAVCGVELASFYAYGEDFRGGVFVAGGDLDGDGRAEIITGAGDNGQGHVAVFHGGDLAETGSFMPFGPSLTLGVHVGTADVDGDGKPDILVGVSGAMRAQVDAFSGLSFGQEASFYALPASSHGAFVS